MNCKITIESNLAKDLRPWLN